MRFFLLSLGFIFSVLVTATPYIQRTDLSRSKESLYSSFEGGYLGPGLHLYDLQRFFSPKKPLEKWSFAFKTLTQKKYLGPIPKHHIIVDSKKRKILVRLKRVYLRILNKRALLKRVQRSLLVDSIDYEFDPFEQETIIIFHLNKKLFAKAYVKKKIKGSELILRLRATSQ